MQLLLGCGNDREKRMGVAGTWGWKDLVTVDFDPECAPDVLCDLEHPPLPFEDNTADEIHAYDVLEHIGDQGDWRKFFDQFSDYWRILKHGGLFFATVPDVADPVNAWGDPSHRRMINTVTLAFLSQAQYAAQVGVTRMSDFRRYYKADFNALQQNSDGSTFAFVLQAIKQPNLEATDGTEQTHPAR